MYYELEAFLLNLNYKFDKVSGDKNTKASSQIAKKRSLGHFFKILSCNFYPRIFQTILAVTVVSAYLGHQWECIDAGKNEDQIINFEDFDG